MSRLNHLLCGLVLGLGLMTASAVAAAPAATVEVQKSGDDLVVTVTGSSSLSKPALKMVPGILELIVRPAVLKPGSGKTVAVDRGLIRKVEVCQSAPDTVAVRVHVISRPKNDLQVAAGGRQVKLRLSTMELASEAGPAPRTTARKPKQPRTPAAGPSRTVPARGETAPPVPPESTPGEIATSGPALPTPEPSPQPAAAPSASGSSPAHAAAQKLVSVTYPGGDLRGALEALARAAGLKPDVHPAVHGSVTASFTEIPLNLAVTDLLGQSEELYLYDITDTVLRVYPQHEEAAARPAVPAPPRNAGAPGLAREYFPLRAQRARELAEAARKAVPSLTYTVDDRLNIIIAEGSPEDLQRLRAILRAVSEK